MTSNNRTRSRNIRFFLLLGVLTTGCTKSSETDAGARPSRPVLTAPKGETLSVPDDKPKLSFYTVEHYGDDRNVEEDLKMTMARASAENKRILLQVGGDWCGWCKLLTGFIEKQDAIREMLDKNYLLMKVTYTQKNPNEAFLSKYPKIAGYPHLFVLDAAGNLLHSMHTTPLEEGKSYNEERVMAFLEEWKKKD